MKIILTILTLSLLLTACSRQTAKISKQIVGTWQSEGAGTESFNSDASFLFDVRTSTHTNDYAGTWQIRDTAMTLTITNATGPDPEVQTGNTMQFQIIHVDAHHLSYAVSGHTVLCSR
jgi:outer membrane biogenesis lipoprotein LolB